MIGREREWKNKVTNKYVQEKMVQMAVFSLRAPSKNDGTWFSLGKVTTEKAVSNTPLFEEEHFLRVYKCVAYAI